MYTEEQYKKKVLELNPVAQDWMDTKSPQEVLSLIDKMSPADAYIMGRIIGCALQADRDMKEFMHAISSVGKVLNRAGIQNDRFILN